jgi:hypothetical protein
MKAEHRKELKTNTLVATLKSVGQGLKEGPSRRTVVVTGIILLVVLLIVIWFVVKGASDRRASHRWEQLYSASTIDDLKDLADKNRNTVQGKAAQLEIARENLIVGLEKLYDRDERPKAIERLKEAADSFESLAKDFKSTPIIVQECLFGAAQAREAAGELDEALAHCEQFSDRFADSKLAEQAEELAKKIKARKADLKKLEDELKK